MVVTRTLVEVVVATVVFGRGSPMRVEQAAHTSATTTATATAGVQWRRARGVDEDSWLARALLSPTHR